MKPIPSFTRRDFLKLSASSALGLFMAETGFDRALAATEPPADHGRVLMSGLFMYESPSFTSESWKAFGKDQLVPISEVVDGDEGNPYNKTWYRIGDEGFTYSGWVQPVETVYNKPVLDIRAEGQVGEVTVPYTLARTEPSILYKGIRLYYQTTHWVTKTIVNRQEKSIWYEIYDFHLRKSFYIPSYDLRIIPDEELAPLSPEVPEDLKHIHIDLGTQTVTAFEDQTPVLISRCSSGAGDTRTPLGDFRTYHKSPSVHMTDQDAVGDSGYDLPGVPWCSFFTGTGIAFHGTYWHNDYGRPRSHGCVNLPTMDAKFIYRWTNPVVPPGVDYLHLPGQGTAVQVTTSI
ncbi:MAG: L,D-transpeptidase [Anaerolineales bacterium]|jgi:lipoprotein-anchoring transpeptidase ErfK/SrfK